MQNELYTVTQLSRMFSVSRTAVYNWLGEGRFPNAFEVGEGGGKMTLIPLSDVADMKEKEAQDLVSRLEALGYVVTITKAE